MKTVTVAELKKMLDSSQKVKIIDVREAFEADICSIGGELIPLADVIHQNEKFNSQIPVIVYCRSGKRSETAIAQLEQQFGYSNLYNLDGGILAWIHEIDPSMDAY